MTYLLPRPDHPPHVDDALLRNLPHLSTRQTAGHERPNAAGEHVPRVSLSGLAALRPRARNRVLRRPDLRDAQIPLVGSTDRIGQQRGVVDQPHGHHACEKSAQNQSPAHHSADLRQTQFPQSVVLRPVFQTPRGNDAQRVPPQSLLT